ncbi:polymorphic toxin-type HINT domain-containing protein [Calidithermus chliarophilus]|uniref:polymorphic toxin-type HINT domain-containing protein n=1 Tax=Calidithermus chliarophilus TaxID=52023 RepID=UPI0012F66076|nr:polymorphic toxin-type HINT domain-containing protein [Calidithermus chliarophilus]
MSLSRPLPTLPTSVTPPASVLPPVLQALNTLDLRAPTAGGKPGSGLTPPGGGVVPPIGGVPAPIDTVVPPIGGNSPDRRDVRPLEDECTASCNYDSDGDGFADSHKPATNDDASNKNQKEQDKKTGAPQQADWVTSQTVKDVNGRFRNDPDRARLEQAVKDINRLAEQAGVDPRDRAKLMLDLNLAVNTGDYSQVKENLLRMGEEAANALSGCADPRTTITRIRERVPYVPGNVMYGYIGERGTLGSPDRYVDAGVFEKFEGYQDGTTGWASDLFEFWLGNKVASPLLTRLFARLGIRMPAVRIPGRGGTPRPALRFESCNSFSPETKVATATGMVAIAALGAGSVVLAYNEGSGKNEYRPVLERFTQGLVEKEVTYLTLRDDESGLTESLTTTKGHPFYLVKNVDGSHRPAPEGHEELALPWVGQT